jgi:hypothetical protein
MGQTRRLPASPITLIAWAALLTAAACGSGTEPAAPIGSEDRALVASKVATLALAVAVGPQGRSFFDNFIPCSRRGVIDYRNIVGGRRATFTGCDAGDDVVIDGTADIRSSPSGGFFPQITSISVSGALRASVAGKPSGAVDPIDVTGISFATGFESEGIPLLDRLVTGSVRVAIDGATSGLDERASPTKVFHPTLAPTTLPNAQNSVDALSDADVKRIAYYEMMILSSILFDETDEISRGEHTHTAPCGTTHVIPIAGVNLPHIDFDLTDCDVGLGGFIGGKFSAEWTEFTPSTGRLGMVLSGTISLGGGVPRTSFSRIEWNVSGLTTLPATATISGRLVTASGTRSFSFLVDVDD